MLHFTDLSRPVDDLTQDEVDDILNTSEGLICWTVGRTVVLQQRHRVEHPGILGSLEAAARRELWNYQGAHVGQFIDRFATDPALRNTIQQRGFDLEKLLYSTLHLLGGVTLLGPDKTIDYRNTPPSARYAFAFWAFPRSQWLANLRAYLDFADQFFSSAGFRCNLHLGSYHIRPDTNSVLSYTYEQEIVSIDPINATIAADLPVWQNFLQQFNDFAFQRNGLPLLNQSPFVEQKHVQAAYGQRRTQFSAAARSADPRGRMLNPYFASLLASS